MFATPASGQDGNTFSPRWMTAKKSSPLMKSVQASAVYRPSVRISQFHDETNWINESRTLSTYSAGRLVTRYEDVFDGVNWQEYERRDYTYASDGMPASETVFTWDGTAWEPIARALFDSQNGLPTEEIGQIRVGNEWVDDERTVYTIQNGMIVGGQTDYWQGGWMPGDRFLLDQQPDRVHQINQVWTGGAWVNESRLTFAQITIAELYALLTQLIVNLEDYEGLYFSQDFPDATEQVWENAQWVNVSNQTTIEIRDAGTKNLIQRAITTQEWDADGDTWIDSFRMIVGYRDDAGLENVPGMTTLQVPGFVDWENVFVEMYDHQASIGRIIQATLSADFGGGLQEVSRTQIQWIDAAGVGVEEPTQPVTFVLSQNVPNPFNPSTRISYTLSEAQAVQLSVYDLLGRQIEVLDAGVRPVGEHAVSWDASAVASGLYLYRLETSAGVATRTMVLLK